MFYQIIRNPISSLSRLAGVFFLALGPSVWAAGNTPMGWMQPMTNEECWKVMPAPQEGAGSPLPSWVRMIAREMPKTAAAFYELDLAHRTVSPVDPKLRAAMRWTASKANRCGYSQAVAEADALRAGVSKQAMVSLATKEMDAWSKKEKLAIEFAAAMTLDSDGYPDQAFAELVREFDERQVASMVLLLAYSNYQDRLLICLGAPLEKDDTMPPAKIKFGPEAFSSNPNAPSSTTNLNVPASKAGVAKDIIADESPNTWLPYDQLQKRLQQQRERKTRLPIPQWSEFADRLPEGLMEKPSDIVWYKIAFGYADQLAVPFEIVMRTAGSEIRPNWDRLFGNCIFWMVTDAIKCPYCMGHCEMNWEVSGMNVDEIAQVSATLAGDDWSSFTNEQQQALAFARTITKTPWKVTKEEMDKLREGFGDQRAFFITVNTCRYNYMTRISNGFQLTLESENPFWDYYRMEPPKK